MTQRPPVKKPTPEKKSPKKKKVFWRRSIFGFLFKLCLLAAVWGTIFAGLALLWFSYDLPSVEHLTDSIRRPSVTVMTQSGEVIGTYGDLVEDMVHVKDLPPYVPQALVATEDWRFYHHFGVDPIGLVRAAWANYQAKRVVQGGSTITQQLAKNFLMTQGLYNTTDRSLRRKVQEVIMALWLEWNFSKDQILSIYLNRVYFGAKAYGIDAAAHEYFGVSARKLTVYQAAVLAGLLKAPSKYNPNVRPDLAHERAKVVLWRMQQAGYIQSPEKYLLHAEAKAKQQPDSEKRGGKNNGAKYFADWIYEEVPNFVSANDRDLIVVTTMDLRLQRIAEARCKEKLDEMGKDLRTSQIASVITTADGGILALVGGKDYNESVFNRVTKAIRQPGSSFKPFVYLAGLEHGLTPETLIADTPFTIGNWSPQNFRTYKPKGLVTMQDAMAFSVNAVTIRITMEVGPEKVASVARRLGITSTMMPTPSIALGSNDVTLLELNSAFATFANEGKAVWPYGILEIRDKQGNILYQRPPLKDPPQIVSPENVRKMNQMLAAVVRYGYGRSANVSNSICGKTGSNGDIDAWFISHNGNIVMTVWTGNDRNEPMAHKSTGGRLPCQTAAAIWKDILKNADLKNYTTTTLNLEAPKPEAQEKTVDLNTEQQDESASSSLVDSAINEDQKQFFESIIQQVVEN